jgi:outer membrane protein OmpA-like peptidoglycan-associated protein
MTGPDGGFVPLAAATLSTHAKRGEETELSMRAMTPVRWVRVRLAGGINMPRPQAFLEFSEIIGNGTQETPALATHFTGVWQGRGVLIGLRQSGAVVSGCYDTSGRMTGTVTGNVLRGQGIDLSDRTPTSFILSVAPDGTLRGVASTNRAPFRLYTGTGAPPNVRASCAEPPPPVLGCGSVIHGITFAFDSSVIRPESEPVLATLFAGLQADKSTAIVIEGHTSNEGSIQYNQQLSERRAAAVVEDLVRRGITRSRVRPAGLGETRPVAGNDDENGRSMNRRVEVHCG